MASGGGGSAINGGSNDSGSGHGAASSEPNGLGSTSSGNAGGGDSSNNFYDNLALVLQSTHTFHSRCGRRITLSNSYRTATRSVRDYSHALVFSGEPLMDDVLFEVVIERKNNAWGGSIEIGVTRESPDKLELLSSATAMRNGTWVISGSEVRYNGNCINESYGVDLETLAEGDRVGIMRTHGNELVVYVNGESLGVADCNVPKSLWALVNLYGRCVQVTLWPLETEGVNGVNGDGNESAQQQIVQSIDLPSLSVDVTVQSKSGLTALNMSTAESACGGGVSLANALTAATSLCSSLPPSLTLICQQNNNSGNNTSLSICSNSNGGASSAVQNANDFYDMNERLRFHTRCGSLVKLSTNFRSAERRRPLDEFNNGVVMTHRPLKDNELFEIRIDKLVDKWSGSIEVGVTTHNPTVLHFPATMTNMRSGTIMMSGCGILTNGKGTRRQYGEFNLDELAEGDRVGMMRKSNGNLHYYINGQDQGVAATRVATTLWGVIDLYGMTIKVTIVDRDEREQQNLVTRRNNLLLSTAAAAAATAAAAACASSATSLGVGGTISLSNTTGQTPMLSLLSPECEFHVNGGGDSSANGITGAMAGVSLNSSNATRNDDRLTFNPLCGSHAQVTHSGRTALRPNASDDFNNGVVLTRRPLRPNELFQVRLERVVSKWAGSVEMGVTVFSAEELDFPFTMTNVRTGTWMMTGNGVMQNGITVIEQYGQNLDRLQVGDRVGVVRKDDGSLHFWVNGVDQGLAATGVPERVYGVIDLYGQAAQASIVDTSECGSPDTGNSTISNTTLYSEPPLRFHTIHGKNASISNGGLTASRPNSLAEFNDSIVFSNRPLRQRELFEVVLENMVRHWSGNVEIGVTGTRPEDLTLSANATDLDGGETIILCGSMLFYNRKTIRSNVPMDLDSLSGNARVGVMRNGDYIHFFIDGVDQGPACECRSPNIWAIVDLYGQCAQVSLTLTQPAEAPRVAPYATSENSQSCQATSVIQPATLETKHRWTCVSGIVQLSQNWTVASRLSGTAAALTRCLVFSEHPLRLGSPFEIRILMRNPMLAGSLSIGITDLNLSDDYVRRNLPVNIKRIPANVWYLTGNELRHNMRLLQRAATSLEWLRSGDRISLELTTGRTLRVLFNSEDMNIHFKHVAKNPYVVVELSGSTMAIQAISSQGPTSPLRPCILRLQDSLDFGADPLNKQDSMLESIESEVVNLEFLERHGTNVRLLNDSRTAYRMSSFNHGIVFGNKAMSKGETISIKVDKINTKWQGTIGIGVVGVCPVLLDRIPQSILQLTRRCWGITKDYININGQRIPSNYGEPLDRIQAGTVITMSLNFSNMLIITVGGTPLEELGTIPNVVYPIFDLYGKCEQITALVAPTTDVVLNNGISPPLATAASNEYPTTTALSMTTATNITLTNAATTSNDIAMDEEATPSLENDSEQNVSREKADLERHEKETSETVEPSCAAGNDEVENELGSVSATPLNTNASMTRSVMESVSENLLMNLSIKNRTLEQQSRQSDLNNAGSSNSLACCLRESLQLQHDTNLNIQRSQSTQRFQQQQQQQQQIQQQQQTQQATDVHDTNKDYDALEEFPTSGGGLVQLDEISAPLTDDFGYGGSTNSNTFTTLANNDILNDNSSVSSAGIGCERLSSVSGDGTALSTERSILGLVDGSTALLDGSSIGSNLSRQIALTDSSSNGSDSARERSYSVRNGFSLSDILNTSRSTTSTDSSSVDSHRVVFGRGRILQMWEVLRLDDILLDTSSVDSVPSAARSNDVLNVSSSLNDTNADRVLTIAAPSSRWRAQSPTPDATEDVAAPPQDPTEVNVAADDVQNRAGADNSNETATTIAATSTAIAANITRNSPTSLNSLHSLAPAVERRDCAYLKLVKQFFTSLVLPQIFFSPMCDGICYCANCHASGRNKLEGWVYYNLNVKTANAHDVPALLAENDEYLCMYFVTRIDKIRAILDYGQLVPQEMGRGDANWESSASAQKDEPGTRLELYFFPEIGTALHKNGQLRFAHSGQQYRIGAAFEVYVRNQALCSLPVGSLGACGSNCGDLHSLDNFSNNSAGSQSHLSINVSQANSGVGIGGSARNNISIANNAGSVGGSNVASCSSKNSGASSGRSISSIRSNGSGSSEVSGGNNASNLLPSASNSSGSLPELTWFTKEDGACFINALILRLEAPSNDISLDSTFDDLI